MAFTFGAGTGDYVRWFAINSYGGSSRLNVMAAWYYPTTLTAGRGLWSFGDAAPRFCCEIASTTSEILVRSNAATTQGVRTTNGLGLVTDKWQYLAWAVSLNQVDSLMATRVWVGDETTAPVEVTVDATTAPSGANSASTSVIVGNLGYTGAANAWQGDIEGFMCVTDASIEGIPNGPLSHSSYGTIATETAYEIRHRLLIPHWLGQPPQLLYNRNQRLTMDYCPLAGTNTTPLALRFGPENTVANPHYLTLPTGVSISERRVRPFWVYDGGPFSALAAGARRRR